MKFKNLFFTTLTAVALIACGSSDSSSNDKEQEGLSTEDRVNVIENVVENGDKSIPGYIVISKETMTLRLYDKNGLVIYNFPVALGRNYGDKKVAGDMKTPEGTFEIQQIQPASAWSHDFKDGKGVIEHAYGDWFIRLATPGHRGIGIHGTHAPESIGTRATEGCIRLNNENLNLLKPLVRIGMKVTIESSKRDMEADGKTYEPTATTSSQEGASTTEEAKTSTEEKSATESKPAEEQKTVEEPKNEYVPGEIIEHTIESGDSFGKLAGKYNTTSAKIQELNPDLDPTKLQIGQKVKVEPNTKAKPAEKKAEAPAVVEDANGTYHTIVSGDSFGKLAGKYNTTSAKIQELNPDLDPTKLQIGQKVRVK